MDSHIIQLSVALFLAMLFCTLVFRADEKILFLWIITFIPFQPIDSRFGSINSTLTIVFWFALLFKYKINFKERIRVHPFVVFSFVGILVANCLTLTQVPRSILMENFFFVLNFAGNFALISLSVNLIKNEDDIIRLLNWLAFGTLLVVIYSLIQGFLGGKEYALFNIKEFSLKTIRSDVRIVGPFSNSQSYTGYLVIQSLFIFYNLVVLTNTSRQKLKLVILILFVLTALVSSNTRAGMVSFMFGSLLVSVFLFRNYGVQKALRMVAIIGFCIVVSSYIIINYTQYNRLFERLLHTEVHGYEVDTRVGLIPYFMEQIKLKPVFGHRPMHHIPGGDKLFHAGLSAMPHNLYIYVLFATGIFGFTFFIMFFFALFLRLRDAGKRWNNSRLQLKYFPGFCQIVFFIFLIQQYFISLIRWEMRDYQQYIFLIFGLFCAISNIAGRRDMQTV